MKSAIILFDLDNTLVKLPGGLGYFKPQLIETFAQFDIAVTDDEAQDIIDREAFDEGIQKHRIEHREFWKVFDVIDAEIRHKLLKSGQVDLFPEVMGTLTTLQKAGHRMSIVSNTPQPLVDLEVGYLKIKHFFDTILGYADHHKGKPHPTFMEIALSNYPASDRRENVWMIGDSEVDITAGNAVGAKTVLIDHRKINIQKDKPDVTIQSLDELLDIVGVS